MLVIRPVLNDRAVLPSDALLKQFDLISRVYGTIIDEKTKKPLFHPYLASNSVSNPPDTSLYFRNDKDSMTVKPRFN